MSAKSKLSIINRKTIESIRKTTKRVNIHESDTKTTEEIVKQEVNQIGLFLDFPRKTAIKMIKKKSNANGNS